MKVNFKTFFCVLLVIELYYVQSIDGKRSFGITGRRSKSKSPSVRRGKIFFPPKKRRFFYPITILKKKIQIFYFFKFSVKILINEFSGMKIFKRY